MLRRVWSWSQVGSQIKIKFIKVYNSKSLQFKKFKNVFKMSSFRRCAHASYEDACKSRGELPIIFQENGVWYTFEREYQVLKKLIFLINTFLVFTHQSTTDI